MRFLSKQSCTSTISLGNFSKNRNLFAKLAANPQKKTWQQIGPWATGSFAHLAACITRPGIYPDWFRKFMGWITNNERFKRRFIIHILYANGIQMTLRGTGKNSISFSEIGSHVNQICSLFFTCNWIVFESFCFWINGFQEVSTEQLEHEFKLGNFYFWMVDEFETHQVYNQSWSGNWEPKTCSWKNLVSF